MGAAGGDIVAPGACDADLIFEEKAMRRFVVAALAAVTMGAGIVPMDSAAQAQPFLIAPFLFSGQRYCWYDSAWRGPGWYYCGYAWRRGYGWGGGYGWRGHGGHYGHGGGFHGGEGGHGGGGFHGGGEGGGHGGGGHGGGGGGGGGHGGGGGGGGGGGHHG